MFHKLELAEHQLKTEEDEQIIDWKNIIDDISEKVYFIDKTLFEPDI